MTFIHIFFVYIFWVQGYGDFTREYLLKSSFICSKKLKQKTSLIGNVDSIRDA